MKVRRMLRAAAWSAASVLALVGVVALVRVFSTWWGALTLATVAALLGLVAARAGRRVPRRTWVEIDLGAGVIEQPMSGPAGRLLTGSRLPLRDVVDGLIRAADDRRVAGVVLRLGTSGLGVAQAQELREGMVAVRRAGKATIAYADSFGEGGEATTDYYLAAACEQILLQPGGSVGFMGLTARVPFLRPALDRLGIAARFDQREDYKTAANTLTESELTPAHRRAVESVLDARFDQIVSGVAAGRGLSSEAVRAAVDRAPLLATEAIGAGLVDGLAYRDEVVTQIEDEAGGRRLDLASYLARGGRPHRRGKRVALVHGSGPITRGRSRPGVVPAAGLTMGADTMVEAIRAAADDRKVAAILLRVDSPGGSAVASETIWREVVRARSRGKPVVVSMGELAASGGYYVSVAADRVIANPATLTGSIGVVTGKMVVDRALARLGVNFGSAGRGAHAGYDSPLADFDDDEWDRLQIGLDDVYDTFQSRVIDGRGLTPAAVKEAAQGRVWTGSQAIELGLVDDLGGREAALEHVRRVAGLAPDQRLALVEYPRKRAGWRRRRRQPALLDVTASLFDLAATSSRVAVAGSLGRRGALILAPEWWW